MEPIINNYFKYKSLEEMEEVEKKFNNIIDDNEDEINGFSDSIDAEDIFG